MWLPEPRWSPAPHFDGQRWLSAGGCHRWALAFWTAPISINSTVATIDMRIASSLQVLQWSSLRLRRRPSAGEDLPASRGRCIHEPADGRRFEAGRDAAAQRLGSPGCPDAGRAPACASSTRAPACPRRLPAARPHRCRRWRDSARPRPPRTRAVPDAAVPGTARSPLGDARSAATLRTFGGTCASTGVAIASKVRIGGQRIMPVLASRNRRGPRELRSRAAVRHRDEIRRAWNRSRHGTRKLPPASVASSSAGSAIDDRPDAGPGTSCPRTSRTVRSSVAAAPRAICSDGNCRIASATRFVSACAVGCAVGVHGVPRRQHHGAVDREQRAERMVAGGPGLTGEVDGRRTRPSSATAVMGAIPESSSKISHATARPRPHQHARSARCSSSDTEKRAQAIRTRAPSAA